MWLREAVLSGAIIAAAVAKAGESSGDDAAHKWAGCSLEAAQRLVVVKVVSDGRVVSRWLFPVKRWARVELNSQPSMEPEVRWFRARNPDGGDKAVGVSSDTWLGAVDEKSVFVSFEWYRTEEKDASHEQHDGGRRIAKDILEVPFGSTERLEVVNHVSLHASYRVMSRRE